MSDAGSLRFSGSHIWVRVEGSEAVLGLSDYLQDQMGEITSLELPDLGDVLRASLRMGKVESEEASSPIEAPLSTRAKANSRSSDIAFPQAARRAGSAVASP